MDAASLKAFAQENLYYLLLIQLAFGLVFGLVPLIASFRRKRRNLGIIGLLVSLAVSLISPILSLISSVIFTVLVLRKPAAAE